VFFLEFRFFPFDIFETFDSTLSWIDACYDSTGSITQGEKEGEWHVIVSACVDDCRGDEWADKRGCFSNNPEETEE
jgi:hypothetical protein